MTPEAKNVAAIVFAHHYVEATPAHESAGYEFRKAIAAAEQFDKAMSRYEHPITTFVFNEDGSKTTTVTSHAGSIISYTAPPSGFGMTESGRTSSAAPNESNWRRPEEPLSTEVLEHIDNLTNPTPEQLAQAEEQVDDPADYSIGPDTSRFAADTGPAAPPKNKGGRPKGSKNKGGK